MATLYVPRTKVPVQPDHLANLAAWYKADSLALADNDPVVTWLDSSGNNRTLTRLAVGKEPRYRTNKINGYPALTFGPTGTPQGIGSAAAAMSNDYTYVMVVKLVSHGANHQLWSTGTTVSGRGQFLRGISNGKGELESRSLPNNTNWATTSDGHMGKWAVLFARRRGANLDMHAGWNDAITGGSGIPGAGVQNDDSSGWLGINSTSSTGGASFECAEFFYYTRGLTDLEIGDLWISMANKYAIPPRTGPTSALPRLWLKADALALANNAAVTEWADSSNSGPIASQATALKQPIFKTNQINGLPTVFFDGVDDELRCAFNVQSTAVATIIAVVRMPDALESGGFVKIGAGGDGYGLGVGNGSFDTDGNKMTAIYESRRWIDSGVNYGLGFRIASLRIDADGTARFYLDGTLVATSAGTAPFAPTVNTIIGAGNAGSRFGAYDIAEVLTYDSPLADAARLDVERYLGAKYGIVTP